VQLTTDGARDYDAIAVEALSNRPIRWSASPGGSTFEAVVFDPDLIGHVGRVSGVLDAFEDGRGELRRQRPAYGRPDHAAFVHKEAKRLDPRAFAKLTGVSLKVVERAALGEPISAPNLAIALDRLLADDGTKACACGCEETFHPTRSDQRDVDNAHRMRARRQGVERLGGRHTRRSSTE
jgi:hypothetical protein